MGGMDWIDLAQDGGQVAGSCTLGNEPSGSIKCGEFFLIAKDLLAFQAGLCSIGLLNLIYVTEIIKSKKSLEYSALVTG
jgi:hypothetical protein